MANSKKTEAEAVTEEVETAEAPAEAPAEGTPPESIGLQDLQLLAQIVDLASQRGAFRGNELTQVGAVFDKLSTFLNYVNEQNQAEEGAEESTEAPATEDAPTGE